MSSSICYDGYRCDTVLVLRPKGETRHTTHVDTVFGCDISYDSPGHGTQVRDRLTHVLAMLSHLLPRTRHLEHHVAVGGATDVLGTRRTRLIVAPATPRTRPHARRPRRHARHVRCKTTSTSTSSSS